MNNCHFVCCTTDIRYDGRVYSLIQTLAQAFPHEKIHIYNLLDKNIQLSFPSTNVIYRRIGIVSRILPECRITRLLSCYEYAFWVFLFFLIRLPKTVQVHHEGVLLAPYLYKRLFPKIVLVFDDKELYHPHDRNIPRFLYQLELGVIKKADLTIFTNQERERAVNWILRGKKLPSLIVYNYVFNNKIIELDPVFQEKISRIKASGHKILLHQGALSNIRGIDRIKAIIRETPSDWKVCFIGIPEKDFQSLKLSLEESMRDKIVNIGYVSYEQLNSFWRQVDAAIMFYDACSFNNNYCAPNRLYLAVNNGVPFIGNNDNYTLSSFIRVNGNGVLIPPEEEIRTFFREYSVIRERSWALIDRYNYGDGILQEVAAFYASLQ